MKKLLFILPILVVLIFTGCTQQAEETEGLTDITEAIVTDEQGVESKNAIMYNDSIYGFSINLPNEWDPVETNNETKQWEEGITSQVIYFGRGINDKIFSIEIIKREDWKTINAIFKEQPDHPLKTKLEKLKLAENDQFIFIHGPMPPSEDERMIRYRQEDVPRISETFKLK